MNSQQDLVFNTWLNNLNVELLVAADLNGAIGFENHMPWKLKDDLKFFKESTMNRYLLLGNNTFKSLYCYPNGLPGRISIVLTTNRNLTHNQDCYKSSDSLYYVTSNQAALKLLYQLQVNDLVVMGGAFVYKQWFAIASSCTLTLVNTKIAQSDAQIDLNLVQGWDAQTIFSQAQDQNNQYDFTAIKYSNPNSSLGELRLEFSQGKLAI